MNTEREQLELAAKACGFKDAEWAAEQACICTLQTKRGFHCFWNPARDDGDCARMEAQLGICIDWRWNAVKASHIDLRDCEIEKFNDHNNDRNAARRAASVAVAAEIGRVNNAKVSGRRCFSVVRLTDVLGVFLQGAK